jgi:hypothetical protein
MQESAQTRVREGADPENGARSGPARDRAALVTFRVGAAA